MNSNSEIYTTTPEQPFGREFDAVEHMEQVHSTFVAEAPTVELNVEAERSKVNSAFEATEANAISSKELDAHGIRISLHIGTNLMHARSQKAGQQG